MKKVTKNFLFEVAEDVAPVVPVAPVTPVVVDDTAKIEAQKVIDGLKLQIDNLTKDVTAKTEIENVKKALETELTQLKESLTGKEAVATEYEAIVKTIIESKLLSIPENLKSLVPANASLKDQLAWLTLAEESGIFKPIVETTKINPDVEIGKPLNPNNGNKNVDTSKLSASAIMALAYGNSKPTGKKNK